MVKRQDKTQLLPTPGGSRYPTHPPPPQLASLWVGLVSRGTICGGMWRNGEKPSITKCLHFTSFAQLQLGSILCPGCQGHSLFAAQWWLCGTFSSALNEAMKIEGKQKSMGHLAMTRTQDAQSSEDPHRFPCPGANSMP